jgi:hypothetical protein
LLVCLILVDLVSPFDSISVIKQESRRIFLVKEPGIMRTRG